MANEKTTTWGFCPVCQNVIRCNGGVWDVCAHDYRPNSPYGVMQNQEKELTVVQWMRESMEQVRCYQSPLELEAMLGVLMNVDIKTIVEIGTFHGGNAHLFRNVWPDAEIITIDLNYDFWMAGKDAKRIVGDTRAQETVDVLLKALDGKPVDFLFIDGDHSRAGALNDWAKYAPLVREGGVIGFHDTAAIPEVTQVFKELPAKMRISFSSHQGIGLLFK
jgi:predicted O-methyltransferase YrrM